MSCLVVRLELSRGPWRFRRADRIRYRSRVVRERTLNKRGPGFKVPLRYRNGRRVEPRRSTQQSSSAARSRPGERQALQTALGARPAGGRGQGRRPAVASRWVARASAAPGIEPHRCPHLRLDMRGSHAAGLRRWRGYAARAVAQRGELLLQRAAPRVGPREIRSEAARREGTAWLDTMASEILARRCDGWIGRRHLDGGAALSLFASRQGRNTLGECDLTGGRPLRWCCAGGCVLPVALETPRIGSFTPSPWRWGGIALRVEPLMATRVDAREHGNALLEGAVRVGARRIRGRGYELVGTPGGWPLPLRAHRERGRCRVEGAPNTGTWYSGRPP